MAATYKLYIREDRANNRGECPIYLRITFNRKHKYFNTGIRLKPKFWNPDREEVRNKKGITKKQSEELNVDLQKILEAAGKAYRDLNREKRVSAEAIKTRLEYSSKDCFFQFAADYVQQLKNDKRLWTYKHTRVAVEKMKAFHGSEHLPTNEITPDFLTRFQSYLKKTNKPVTIRKTLQQIKNVLKLAVAAKLIPQNPFDSDDFVLVKQKKGGSKTKLSLKQIQAIESLELPTGKNIFHARNAFLLSFYLCGARFGDLAELRWENVKNGRIVYDMNKTGNPVNLPIKEGVQKILDAYIDQENNGYIFPFLKGLTKEEQIDGMAVRKRISSWNAIVNGKKEEGAETGLKQIAKMAGIDETVSMHIARHSFAQYAVNDKEIPAYKIMMLLGHQDLQTTMRYLKSLDLKTVDAVMDEIF